MLDRYLVVCGYRLDSGMLYGHPTYTEEIVVVASCMEEAGLKAIDEIYIRNNYKCSHVTIINVSLCE